MIEICAVHENDYEKLSFFLASHDKNRNSEFWIDRFKIWWDSNPAFSSKSERGWILRDAGQIVGFLGNIPTRFILFGNEVTAFNGTNFIVLPKYRQYSLQLFFRQLAGAPIVFMTSACTKAVKILKAFKLPMIPNGNVGKYHKRSVILLNPYGLMKIGLSRIFNEIPSTRPSSFIRGIVFFLEKIYSLKTFNIGEGICNLTGTILKIYQSVQLRKVKKVDCSNIREISIPDSRIDQLWKKTWNRYENTNVRSSDTLRWYLANKNGSRRIVLFGYFEGEILHGYAMFKINDGPILRMDCIDIWAEQNKQDLVKAFIKFAWEYAEKNSFNAVVFPHFNKEIKALFRKCGLISLSMEERRDYYKLNLRGSLNENASYFITQGDQDIW